MFWLYFVVVGWAGNGCFRFSKGAIKSWYCGWKNNCLKPHILVFWCMNICFNVNKKTNKIKTRKIRIDYAPLFSTFFAGLLAIPRGVLRETMNEVRNLLWIGMCNNVETGEYTIFFSFSAYFIIVNFSMPMKPDYKQVNVCKVKLTTGFRFYLFKYLLMFLYF